MYAPHLVPAIRVASHPGFPLSSETGRPLRVDGSLSCKPGGWARRRIGRSKGFRLPSSRQSAWLTVRSSCSVTRDSRGVMVSSNRGSLCKAFFRVCRVPGSGSSSQSALSSDSLVGQRMAVSFGIEFYHGLVDSAVEVIRTVERLMCEVMPLQVAPETLDVVQLRSIFRQPLDPEPVGALGEGCP